MDRWVLGLSVVAGVAGAAAGCGGDTSEDRAGPSQGDVGTGGAQTSSSQGGSAAAAGLSGGSGGGAGIGHAGAAAGGPSCVNALATRSSGIAPCVRGDEARCTQIEQEPDREVEWYILLDDSYSDSQLQEHCACLTEYLDARGAEALGCGSRRDAMRVIGTYVEVAPVLQLEIIEEYRLLCWRDTCDYCTDLALDDCAQDAFCSILTGARFDVDLGCAWEREPAGCTVSDFDCGDSVTWALDPSGNCWEFPSTCQPTGFTADTLNEPDQEVSCHQVFSGETPPCE